MAQLQKITPCLWFGGNADEAVRFYTSIFANSRIVGVSHYGEGAPMPKGSVLLLTMDGARSNRVMQAVTRMTKLDIAELRRAYEGRD